MYSYSNGLKFFNIFRNLVFLTNFVHTEKSEKKCFRLQNSGKYCTVCRVVRGGGCKGGGGLRGWGWVGVEGGATPLGRMATHTAKCFSIAVDQTNSSF